MVFASLVYYAEKLQVRTRVCALTRIPCFVSGIANEFLNVLRWKNADEASHRTPPIALSQPFSYVFIKANLIKFILPTG